MANNIKGQNEILQKLGISKLNTMQEEAVVAITETPNTIVLSPTGTGKTLAFALPLIDALNPEIEELQALILVPSRELAIQIEQVIRNMGSGFKVNAVYGGRPISKDKIELKKTPAILIGTPGRIADHFTSDRIDQNAIKTLVLDEFDKMLEIGFEEEMRFILKGLTGLTKRVLTSATQGVEIPAFVGLNNAVTIDYLGIKKSSLAIKLVESPTTNKLSTLVQLLGHLGDAQGIIFCNFKDSIQAVSDFLSKNNLEHGCFNGGMEQRDRERALLKFRNGTYKLLVATDLAARGIDIPEMNFIIHYELPIHSEEFTHRNGRTARVSASGTAFVLKYKKERMPDFIKATETLTTFEANKGTEEAWATIFISGGRKDKISKGDIVGLFFKQGNIAKDQLGVIELKNDCAFVAVHEKIAADLVEKLNNTRLKKKKVRLNLV